jgi:hypothetical protein
MAALVARKLADGEGVPVARFENVRRLRIRLVPCGEGVVIRAQTDGGCYDLALLTYDSKETPRWTIYPPSFIEAKEVI